jgi:hypothetical protein
VRLSPARVDVIPGIEDRLLSRDVTKQRSEHYLSCDSNLLSVVTSCVFKRKL